MNRGRHLRGRPLRINFATVALTVVTLAILFPIVLNVLTSLKPMREIVTAEPRLLPVNPTWDNYVKLFSLRGFRHYMGNSLLVATLTAALGTLIASVSAYALVWLTTPGRKAISSSLFLTYMFPEIILVIPLFMMCYDLGLIDSRLALVLVYLAFSLPFSVWLLKLAFEALPPQLIEASRLDGCSDAACLRLIIWPMVRPVLATVFVLSFVMGWNEYLYANTIITSDGNRTIAVGLQTLAGSHQVDFGLLSAAGVVMVVPVIILFVLLQKHIVQNLGLGGARRT